MNKRKLLALGMLGGGAAPFVPSDVTGLTTWWDLSLLSTLWQDTARTTPVTADAQAIGGITDRSGQNFHHSEVGPVYKANIQNGKSVGRLNGTNQRFILPSPPAIGTNDFYMLFAFKVNTIAAGNTAIFSYSLGSYVGCLFFNAAGTITTYNTTFRSFTHLTLGTGNHVLEFRREGGIYKLILDGVEDSDTYSAAGISMPTPTLVIGNIGGVANRLSGDLWEYLLYSGCPDVTNRGKIRDYIVEKWNPF